MAMRDEDFGTALTLFPGTLFGTSFWARFLFENCACLRPLCRVAAWYADQGVPISPGTLANSLKRFVPLFDPLYEAILAHQNRTTVRHADETGWRVQEFRDTGRSSRAWLWVSVSKDSVYYIIDPSRSAEVARILFRDTACTVFLVCDRYSAYKTLARELAGKVILCWCWAHQRRDFVDCATGQEALTEWCQEWVERIALVYHLNDERLKHYDPALERQTRAFDAQRKLGKAVKRLFADAEAELAGLPDKDRRAKPLRSLLNHREGLCVFVDNPQVPMDNNAGERAIRGPAIGRRLSFGSNSEDGAKFTATMYSVIGTLSMNGIDVPRWLEAWLKACAKNGGKPAGRPVPVAALDDERGAQAQVHGAGMIGAIECRYYGRDFTTDEMALLRALIAADPQPTRAALSREFCRRIGWFKPDGGLKDMMAKVTMLAMHRDGVIVLPPPRGRQGRPKPIVFGPDMGGSDAALFRESDNLESIYARAALRQFYGALWRGSIEGWNLERFEKATGLKLTWEGSLKEDLPPMPRFLNRLLALPIAEQNQLFAELEARIASNIEQAMEAGSYEVGVETVTADSLAIAGRETLYEHPGTGAATELVEIVRRDKLVPLDADAALEIGERDPGPDGKPRLAVNGRSKRAAVILPASSRMIDNGGVQERVRLVRPATGETMARAELDASNWRHADEAAWRRLWDAEIAGLPSHRESRFWLATGLLLPVWDRLPEENMRVRRLTSDPGSSPGQATGESLIGRVLDAEQVRAVRASFGLDGGPAMTGPEAFEAVMERGNALALANGWRLARRRLMGGNRVEIEGPADTDMAVLKRMGCATEIVSWRTRVFAPNADAVERILERWPLAA